MAPRLAIQMTANSSQFRSEMLVASNAVKEAGAAVAAAKEQIRNSFREQITAAHEVGASSNELRQITERAAEMMAAAEEQGASRIQAAQGKVQEAYTRSAAVQREMLDQARQNNAELTKSYTQYGGFDNTAANEAIRRQWETRAALEQAAIEKAAAVRTASLKRVEDNQNAARQMFFRTSAVTEREGFQAQLEEWKKFGLISAETYEKRMKAATAEVRKAIASAAKDSIVHEGEHGFTDVQAVSGLDRTLIDGKPGLRAAERVSMLVPGLTSLARFVFPVVGALAFASALKDVGDDVHKVVVEAREMPGVINAGFHAMHAAAESSADALRRETHELENQLATLEKKPINNLAIELDDARLNADRLAQSAQTAFEKVTELLRANRVGAIGSMMGQGQNGPLFDEIEKRFGKLRDLRDTNRAAVRSGSDTPEALEARKQAYRKEEEGFNQWLVGEYNTRKSGTDTVTWQNARTGAMVKRVVPYAEAHGNQDNALAGLRGAQQMLFDDRDTEDWQERKSAAERGLKQGQNAKSLAAGANEAAKKAEAAQRRLWEERHADWEVEAERSQADEYNFWMARMAEAERGSANYVMAEQHAAEAIRQVRRENRVKQAENDHLEWELQKDFRKLEKDEQDKQLEQITEHGLKMVQSQAALASARQRADRSREDAAIDGAVSSGDLSQRQARELRAQMELQRYQEDRADLQAKLTIAGHREWFNSDEEQKTALATANTDILKLDTEHTRAVMEHEAQLAGETWRAGLKRGIDGFVDDAQDGARQASQLFTGFLGGTNQALATAFSHIGERGTGRELGNAVGGVFRNTAGQLASTGLQRAEAGLFKSLGFGAPTGRRGDPLHVIMDSLGTGTGTGVLDAVKAGNAGGFGGFLKSAAGWLTGARADGGPIHSGKWLVGERGPEILDIGGSGYVTPNDRLSGGSSPFFHIPVDARGANDPAEVEAAAHRAVMAAAPHIIAAAAMSGRDQRARTPSSLNR